MSDTDEQSLESMLRLVPLRRPSNDLDARIRASMSVRRFPVMRYAAAAVVLVGFLGIVLKLANPRPSPTPVAAVTAVDLTTRLTCDTVEAVNDSLVVTDNTPFTVTRQTTMHEEVLIDPKTHARLEVRTPVDRVVISKAEVF